MAYSPAAYHSLMWASLRIIQSSTPHVSHVLGGDPEGTALLLPVHNAGLP